MLWSRWFYPVRKAVQGAKESPFLHLVTLGTVTISIFILSTFLFITFNVGNLVEGWRGRAGVVVFLQRELSSPLLDEIGRRISSIDGVKGVRLVTKEEAMARLRRGLGKRGHLLDGLGWNPLPPSVEVELESASMDGEALKALLKRIKEIKGVEDVELDTGFLQRVKGIFDLWRMFGLVIGGLIILAITFIISNTIRLTVYARRKEIEIMRLVGATERLIMAPFLMEGIGHGLLGTSLALVGLYVIYQVLLNRWEASLIFPLLGMKMTFLPLPWIAALFAGGGLMGGMGSIISLRRFLRENG